MRLNKVDVLSERIIQEGNTGLEQTDRGQEQLTNVIGGRRARLMSAFWGFLV